DQWLIKSRNTQADFNRIEETAWDIPYIVMARDRDDFTDELLRRNIRYIGVDALFDSENTPIAQTSYTENMSKKHLVTWANGIVYDYKAILSAGHNDDVSVSENPDLGWGWLIDRGFRIIQTDWTLALDRYLNKRNLR
ncbi:MAG: glycerophosphodiester phosphodiesterase, partial [Lachnospiraceae bacterium]|nr:glycerophosphodiester phosphodiesterase [Lachnospiraceae bacterium]